MSSVGFQPETVDGGRLNEDAAARLHALKNRPDPPTINGAPIEFPPYRYQAYPRAMYHLNDPASPKKVADEQEERNLLSRGWTSEPSEVQQAFDEHYDKTTAIPAAERAYDDRRLSAAAKAELKAIEDAADDHVLDVPAPKKSPRGRPAKPVPPPTAA